MFNDFYILPTWTKQRVKIKLWLEQGTNKGLSVH